MKISKQELEERRARVADGTADDDDRRLVELYSQPDTTRTEQTRTELVATGEAEVIPAKKTARGRARNGDTQK